MGSIDSRWQDNSIFNAQSNQFPSDFDTRTVGKISVKSTSRQEIPEIKGEALPKPTNKRFIFGNKDPPQTDARAQPKKEREFRYSLPSREEKRFLRTRAFSKFFFVLWLVLVGTLIWLVQTDFRDLVVEDGVEEEETEQVQEGKN
jgi:hypothetical protein